MDFSQRYKRLDNQLITRSTGEFKIIELEKSGKAELVIKGRGKFLVFNKTTKKKVPFLRNRRCADGVVIEMEDGRPVALHIVELKKSVDQDTWDEKIEKQFEGGLYNALAILGILELDIPRTVKFYTAMQGDSTKANPLTRSYLGGQIVDDEEDLSDTQGWYHDKIDIGPVKEARHELIQWDWTQSTEHTVSLS